jgi:ketosteroid isomerase-like protein
MQPSFLRIAVAPIFAFTCYALLPASHICASTASAETQSTEQEQIEKTAVDHALSDYSDAFGRGDLSAIGQHCDVPFAVISSRGVKLCRTMAEIEAFYSGVLRDLRARGYSHSTRSELRVKLLDQTTALASAVFVRHKTDGSELETIGATYMLRKTEGEWRIAVVNSLFFWLQRWLWTEASTGQCHSS